MKTWLINIAVKIIVGKIIPGLINNSIGNSLIDSVADKYAKIVTDTGKKIAGNNWNKLEDSLQLKVSRFVKRFMTSLDYDD